MKQKLAVITGADGGMGMEITRAVATAGYKVIMACRDPEIAEEKRQLIMRETGNIALEIVPVNLASLSSTASFASCAIFSLFCKATAISAVSAALVP